MSSSRSTPAQRAQHRIAGPSSYPILIAAPGNQTYVLDPYVPGFLQVTGVAVQLDSGTITVNVQRIRAGVTVSVGGLSAVAGSSVNALTASLLDDTSLFQPGDILQVTLTANAAGVNASIAPIVKAMGGAA